MFYYSLYREYSFLSLDLKFYLLSTTTLIFDLLEENNNKYCRKEYLL